jgi:hypothetical protein
VLSLLLSPPRRRLRRVHLPPSVLHRSLHGAHAGLHALLLQQRLDDTSRDIADSATFLASAKSISGLVLDVAAGGNARYTG